MADTSQTAEHDPDGNLILNTDFRTLQSQIELEKIHKEIVRESRLSSNCAPTPKATNLSSTT